MIIHLHFVRMTRYFDQRVTISFVALNENVKIKPAVSKRIEIVFYTSGLLYA